MNYLYCLSIVLTAHTTLLSMNKNQQCFMLYGSATNQGRPKDMEDHHEIKKITVGKETMWYAGVFDGHGSDSVAHYLQKTMPDTLSNTLKKESCGQSTQSLLKYTFKKINEKLPQTTDVIGSTATVVVVNKQYIYLAHVGDSRAIDNNGVTLTTDHKPSNKEEFKRIGEKNFFYNKGTRLGGVLAITRAFGDFGLQKLGLTAMPETKKIARKDIDFIIIGSNGLWDLVDNESAAHFVRTRLAQGMTPERTARELLICSTEKSHQLPDIDLHACSDEDLLNTDLFYSLREVNDNQTAVILQFKDMLIKK